MYMNRERRVGENKDLVVRGDFAISRCNRHTTGEGAYLVVRGDFEI